VGQLKNVLYADNPHDLGALNQNIREAVPNIQQRELQAVSRYLFKEFPHVSQQMADVLNSSMMVNAISIAVFD
jgi:hypothetical protein